MDCCLVNVKSFFLLRIYGIRAKLVDGNVICEMYNVCKMCKCECQGF